MIGEYDWGVILLDGNEEPQPFYWSKREDSVSGRTYFAIDAAVCTDEWGAPMENVYGRPRLRLTMVQLEALRQAGYTDVELTVGEAQARIPLATLFAEYVDGESTLVVGGYEIRLWLPDETGMEPYEQQVLADSGTVIRPCHFEVLALPEQEDADAEDVLSLMDGIQLLLIPQETPDYQNVPYSVIRAPMADSNAATTEGAMFIMEDGAVKCVLTPLFSGMYALVRG